MHVFQTCQQTKQIKLFLRINNNNNNTLLALRQATRRDVGTTISIRYSPSKERRFFHASPQQNEIQVDRHIFLHTFPVGSFLFLWLEFSSFKRENAIRKLNNRKEKEMGANIHIGETDVVTATQTFVTSGPWSSLFR